MFSFMASVFYEWFRKANPAQDDFLVNPIFRLGSFKVLFLF